MESFKERLSATKLNTLLLLHPIRRDVRPVGLGQRVGRPGPIRIILTTIPIGPVNSQT